MKPDQPEMLLRKARQDQLVLERLLEDRDVDDDTLGFHAQQAVEKLLKAVLASRGVEYPRTHNLRVLIELLAKDGIQMPEELSQIARLTQFGTTFRYDAIQSVAAGERAKRLDWVQVLRAFTEPLIR